MYTNVKSIIHCVIAILTTVCVYSNLLADATISIKSNAQTYTLHIKDNIIAFSANEMVHPDDPQEIVIDGVIFDNTVKSLSLINHQKRQFQTISEQQLNLLKQSYHVAESTLGNLNDESQQAVSDFLGGFGISVPKKTSNKVELHNTESEFYLPFACDTKIIKQTSQTQNSNQVLAKACISNGNTTSLSQEDYETMFSIQQYLLEQSKYASLFQAQLDIEIPQLHHLDLSGLLLALDDQFSPEKNISYEVSSIKNKKIDVIAVPQSYQQTTFFSF